MNNNKEKKHQEVIDKLEEIPKVQDARDKEEIYNQISSRLNKNAEQHGKTKKFMPFAAAMAAALLFIILLPVFLNTDMQQTSEEDTMNMASDLEMGESNEDSTIQYNQESSEGGTNEESSQAEQETSLMETENESLVVQDVNQNENIYFAGLSDIRGQYVIPLAYIASGERDLQAFYNNMEEYVSEWKETTGKYLFKNVEFQITQSDNEVVLELPDDFSLAGGSARANMFEKILATMFRPYGTEKVTIQTAEGKPADLDPFGEINEMSLQQVSPSSYKLYEIEDIKMLIPIPNDEQTGIEEAIMELKEDEVGYHVYKTVPEDIQFTIEPDNKHLNFVLSDDANLRDDQDSLEMIEAVLMTAKSYGYEQVSFENTDQEHIGPYNLTEPVPVPEAVNPIYLDD
ncbi:hypothetical protein ACDX78_21985 [Virgibacillus oceani]